MIEDLAQAGRATADRLVLADALVCDYVKLIASDGADVTRDLTVIPTAMIWVCDRERAVVVVAVERQDSDTNYLADVSIRPYARDSCDRRIITGALPETHERCQMATRAAALALAVHRAERRLLIESLDLKETHRVVSLPYVPGPTVHFMEEDQWDTKFQWEADENGDCCVIDNTPDARSMLQARGEAHAWSQVDGEGTATYIVAGIRRDAIAFYRCVIPRQTFDEDDVVVRLEATDDPCNDDGSEH